MSPATGRRYPLRMVCEVYRLPRSTVYASRVRERGCRVTAVKRGPRTAWSDEQVAAAIREALTGRPFCGEGHRKVVHLLRRRGLRHDWGPQYTADHFLGELRWLGIASTPSYVGEPQCNGVMERFIRTLKEECLYLRDFESLEEARAIVGAFVETYNAQWLIERHGYLTPTEARRELLREAA